MSSTSSPAGSRALPLISLGALLGLLLAGGLFLAWRRVAAPGESGPATTAPPASHADHGEASQPASADDILYWTCGMHPSVRASGPGDCPVCHMDLIPVRTSDLTESGAGDEVETRLQVSEQGRLLARVETVTASLRPLRHEINATGRLTIDESRVSQVHSRVNGWIDEVHVEYTGATVRPGDPLVSIYSEDLVTAQQELLQALAAERRLSGARSPRAAESAGRLVDAARQRLRRWNLTPSQVRAIEETGEIQETITLFYEPAGRGAGGGIVTERSAVDGQAVAEGDRLFTVADLSRLWMEADVFEYELGWLAEGLTVEIRSVAFPGRMFEGIVSFISPVLDPGTRTVRVRVEVPNPGFALRPEMFVDARILVPVSRIRDVLTAMGREASERLPQAARPTVSADPYLCPMLCPTGHSAEAGQRCPECGMDLVPRQEVLAMHPELASTPGDDPVVTPAGEVLSIPDLAVLRTGEREIVYVETEPGAYVRREIVTGPAGRAGDGAAEERWVPVLAGLSAGERVVTRGNFMLDSQSTITSGAAAAYGSALETGASAPSPPAGHRH